MYLYPAERETPYERADLAGVGDFVAALDGRTVSQSELQELLECYGPAEVEVEKYAAFLESGPWAAAREETLREGADFLEPAILDADVDRYAELRKARKPTDGLFVPVPRRLIQGALGRWPPVARAAHYDRQYGFLDTPREGGA